jgi:hypothetical protein
MVDKAAHLMGNRNQRKTRGTGDKGHFLKMMLHIITFSSPPNNPSNHEFINGLIN